MIVVIICYLTPHINVYLGRERRQLWEEGPQGHVILVTKLTLR
jgi:hypothetical protein